MAELPKQDTSDEQQRIQAELVSTGRDTDPFVAAVRATRMPMIITNPRLPDNPVVFANNAFCRLTGYARDEIVGRNCRFLQGSQTDRDTVRRIQDAVEQVQSIEVDICNHRKDGCAFWNRLLMAPVRDANGLLTYFFASQLDVTIKRGRLADLESNNAALIAELAGRLRQQQASEDELRFALEAGQFGARSLDIAAASWARRWTSLQSDVRIDLLITDVGLPGGLNGRQVVDAARASRPGLRIIFITGDAENAVLGNGPLGRGMSVITKPFEMETLARKIRESFQDAPAA